MKSILQNFLFVLKRFKTSSVLNILGLSVALAVFTVSFLQAEYDFSFDKNFKKHRDIYRLSSKMSSSNVELPVVTTFMANDVARKSAEIKSYCVTSYMGKEMKEEVFTALNRTEEYNTYHIETTNGFLDVFTPEIISGESSKIFEEPGFALVSEKLVKKIFGDENPIGKTLVRKSDDMQLTILAIYKDFPERSSLVNGIYTKLADNDDTPNNFNLSYFAFFEIDRQHVDVLTEKINDNFFEGFLGTWLTDFRFIPLKELHYQNGGGSRNTTLSLLAIGIVILIISFINFVNFSVALAPSRLRELNIKKILGEGSFKLRLILASEALLFLFFSFILSLFIIYFINRSFVSEFLSADISLANNIKVLIFLGISVSAVGFIVGLYPAFYSTKFQPASILNGKFALSKKSAGLRNTLVTIQFFASIVLIIVSMLLKIQHDFMHKESWKFDRDNIVFVPADKEMQYEAFMADLETSPDIVDYTYSSFLPGTVGMYFGTTYKDETITIAGWQVAHNFLDFFGIPMREGMNFSNDTTAQLILNQKSIDSFEFVDIIGDTLINNSKVCGIIDNINFQPLHLAIEPMGFLKGQAADAMNYFLIKINGQNTNKALNFIEKTWKKTHTGDFDIHFLDESFDTLYKSQNDLSKLITLFGFIALLIALMGVYGLILFNTKYKAKEIAIRKVNGSTEKEIIFLLNRSVLIQLGIAFIISVPTAYFIVRKWLEGFAYKINISWWVFALAGIIVLIITLITVSGQTYKSARTNPTDALSKE